MVWGNIVSGSFCEASHLFCSSNRRVPKKVATLRIPGLTSYLLASWYVHQHKYGASLGNIWCLPINEFLKINFDSLDVLLLLILSVFSLLSHFYAAWPVAWCGFAQIPGRLGCYQRSNRHWVSLYKFPGEGDHVSRVHKAALHRGRFPAGIRRKSKDYSSVTGRGGVFEEEGRMTDCIMLRIVAVVVTKVVMRGLRC